MLLRFAVDHRKLPQRLDSGTIPICLCVCTLRRTWQLEACLPQNALRTWPHRSAITWYVCDFNSDEEESAKVRQCVTNLCDAMWVTGHIRYYRCPAEFWDASLLKNTVHQLPDRDDDYPPTPKVLVNVDGDNIVTDAFLTTIIELAPSLCKPYDSQDAVSAVLFHGQDGGVTGRVAIVVGNPRGAGISLAIPRVIGCLWAAACA